jgi:hypothetical protein
MSAENIANRVGDHLVEDQAYEFEGEPQLDLLKNLTQGGTVRMYQNTEVRDFAYGKAGDVKIVDKTSAMDTKNKTRPIDKAEDLKAEDKIGAPSLEDEHSAAGKTNTVSVKDEFIKLSNAFYVPVEKKRTSTVNVKDEKSTEAEMGVVNVMGKNGSVYLKGKNAAVDVKDENSAADVEDKRIAAAVQKDSHDYLNEGPSFDMEDFVCKYTHSGSIEC